MGTSVILSLCLLFAFTNGFRNSSLIVSTLVSTRVLSPTKAFVVCAISEFTGALLLGSAVAHTVGNRLLGPAFAGTGTAGLTVIAAALCGAIFWGTVSYWRGWPISNNQAFVGGFVGASWAAWGIGSLNLTVVLLILAVLVGSPLIGFGVAWTLAQGLKSAGQWMTPKVIPVIEGLHVTSSMAVAAADGSNDAQLVAGVLMLAVSLNHPGSDTALGIPLSTRMLIASSIAMGVLFGGRRILKKMGLSFYRLQTIQGTSSQLSSAALAFACLAQGFPASISQILTGSIVGSGVAKNARAMKWPIAQDTVVSWFITIPGAAVAAALFVFALGVWR